MGISELVSVLWVAQSSVTLLRNSLYFILSFFPISVILGESPHTQLKSKRKSGFAYAIKHTLEFRNDKPPAGPVEITKCIT